MRFTFELLFGASEVELRMLLNPRMVHRCVIGYEVQEQPHTTLPESFTQASERLVSTVVGVDFILLNRKTRTTDVFFPTIGQEFPILSLPCLSLARNLSTGSPCLPNAKEPYPVEPRIDQLVELLVGDIVQCGLLVQPGGEFLKPNPGIDLVEGRVQVPAHAQVQLYSGGTFLARSHQFGSESCHHTSPFVTNLSS